MKRKPVILVSPDFEPVGSELADPSISLSVRYGEALMAAGAVPLTLPATTREDVLAQAVRACDGVLLTGGDDINPRLYRDRLPAKLSQTVQMTPDGGERDLRELVVLKEVLRQRKPLLAICRGHQLLNIALGGTLFVDLDSERPGPLQHRRLDQRYKIVHEVRLTPGSLLAKITRKLWLGVNSTHHQSVQRVAEPLQVTAASPDGVVEGLEFKPSTAHWLPWCLSVQFHPERLVDRYPEHQEIFRAFSQVCSLDGRK